MMVVTLCSGVTLGGIETSGNLVLGANLTKDSLRPKAIKVSSGDCMKATDGQACRDRASELIGA